MRLVPRRSVEIRTDRALWTGFDGGLTSIHPSQISGLAKTTMCGSNSSMWKIALQSMIGLGVLGCALFLSAGRLDIPFFWACLAVMAVAGIVVVSQMDPGLRDERVRPGPGGIDRHLRVMILPFFLSHLVIAGLDVGRLGWSGRLPVAVQMLALMEIIVSISLSAWAVRTNRFFSPVVRIQQERGHHLVTSGPYGWIRHPGYAAVLFWMMASGPALGSWYSIIPLVPALGLILRRATIEDRFLHEHLDGYVDYAGHVRYRLVPGLW